jgi:hypothetical protein
MAGNYQGFFTVPGGNIADLAQAAPAKKDFGRCEVGKIFHVLSLLKLLDTENGLYPLVEQQLKDLKPFYFNTFCFSPGRIRFPAKLQGRIKFGGAWFI